MPICEIDPWRAQYFESARCPDNIFIPTEDSDAWTWNPAHRWVYDKLAVASSQGLDAAPHGVAPVRYPVFSKPIYNLKGMGVGSRVLRSKADYADAYRPGHMWSTLLEGSHVSSDEAVVDGDGHAEVHAFEADDGIDVKSGVDGRHLGGCGGSRLEQEIVDSEFNATAFSLFRLIGLRAERHERAGIHLDIEVKVRDLGFGGEEAAGDDGPHG